MSNTNPLELLHILTGLVQHVGDELDIQFRSGTDSMGNEYKTNKEAHTALYHVLDQYLVKLKKHVNHLEAKARIETREAMAAELRNLIGIE